MNLFGLFVAAGGLAAILWLRPHHQVMGLTENQFWSAMWLLLLGGVVGAKALFVVLGWHHYASGELRFWADFGTGFVFFGGLVGAAVAGGAFAWFQGLNFGRGADYFAVALPIGHAIGRVGCWFRGCCSGHPPHPVQLYEAVSLLAIAWTCRALLRRVEAGQLNRGATFCVYLGAYGALRFLLDPLRADGSAERWLGISAQQGIALGLIASSVLTMMILRRAPGLVVQRSRSFKVQS